MDVGDEAVRGVGAAPSSEESKPKKVTLQQLKLRDNRIEAAGAQAIAIGTYWRIAGRLAGRKALCENPSNANHP